MKKKIAICSYDKINLVTEDYILFCKSDNCYTTVYLNNGSELVMCKSLSKLSKELDSNCFIRVSQSYLVNLQYIKTIHKKEKYLELNNEFKIPFTISIKRFLEELNNIVLSDFLLADFRI
ncbi:MAG TPA: LytTR family DNA-binding domain-containing protein [Pelobium sp.]|nr:LytTR family DNA-binding domain-containing protein [Pelobium sp.]